MSGNLLHRHNGAAADPYTRLVFSLDDGSELRFIDLRKFGRLWLVYDPKEITAELGPEPLEPTFTIERLLELLRGRQAPLKAALLNQKVVAGLGNLYTDEALFLARLHPRWAAGSLSLQEITRLHGGILEALAEGLHDRGSSLGASLRDHINLDGTPGQHQHRVHVFRRTGKPCPICGTRIERIKIGGRSTHFCPQCQPPP
jgi:formamidopyrimidine-DNA glycosylase